MRQWVRAFFITAMTLLPMAVVAAPKDQSAIRQEADIAAPPAEVYAALLNEKQFARLTGAPAKIESSAGGAFSLFGGAISGHNIELVPASMVVQAWRANDWAPGVYSMVRFKLTPNGGGTHVVLDQTGFPASDFHGLSIGWPEHYWTPLKRLSGGK
jgi:activator of HSP90 ATPase